MIEPNDNFLFMLEAIAIMIIFFWVVYINLIIVCFVNDKIKEKSNSYRKYLKWAKD